MGRTERHAAAKADVLEAANVLTAVAGEHVGLRFTKAVEGALATLTLHPGIGSPRWSWTSPRLAGVRSWPVRGLENGLVFYRPSRKGIEVIRVLHGARDILGVLTGKERR